MNQYKLWKDILQSTYKLNLWLETNGYEGWDPYDALNSPYTIKLAKKKPLAILLIQLNLYSPINIRPTLKIKKGISNKTLALLARSYINLYKATSQEKFKEQAIIIIEKLTKRNLCNRNNYCCSSYYFTYIAPEHLLSPQIPDIICTTETMKTLLTAYQTTKHEKYLETSLKAGKYLLNNLYVDKGKYGYFKYTSQEKNKIVFNVSALALDALSKLQKYTDNDRITSIMEKTVKFLMHHQRYDGAWPYSLYLKKNKYYWQIDYHQGFIIDGLTNTYTLIQNSTIKRKLKQTLRKAINFYTKKQFDDQGRSYYRYPIKYPIDIHNQAQGIITLTNLYSKQKKPQHLNQALKITKWTIENMQDPAGYFYIHKYPILTNKIPYIRWAQAWMMLALTEMLLAIQLQQNLQIEQTIFE